MENKVLNYLDFIREKDVETYNALSGIIEHVAKTYQDKYQSEITNVIDTKYILTHMEEGKGANFQNAGKYLQRYFTKGFSKSYNVADLFKAIHYIIFEIIRRENENGKR